MRTFIKLMFMLLILALAAYSCSRSADYKAETAVYKHQLSVALQQNEAYERYYCANEEMLDLLSQRFSDSLMTTKQGFRYLEEKYVVDSLCHSIRP